MKTSSSTEHGNNFHIDQELRELKLIPGRVIQTLSPMQNADGGFGSGHGQISHGAPSYAAILSLAMVGSDESLNLINRKSLYE